MKHDDPASEQLASSIEALFSGRDVYLLLTLDDASVYGLEGLAGLRLAANAMFEAAYHDRPAAETRLASADREGDREQDLTRLKEIRRCLTALRKGSEAKFVLCYHVHGTAAWVLTWSAGMSRLSATDELVGFVQRGLEIYVS